MLLKSIKDIFETSINSQECIFVRKHKIISGFKFEIVLNKPCIQKAFCIVYRKPNQLTVSMFKTHLIKPVKNMINKRH